MKFILKIPRRIKAIVISICYKLFSPPQVLPSNAVSLDSYQTIEYIKKNHVSISRFGNGEIELISGKSKNYQTYDKALVRKLEEIIINPIKGHISCLPYFVITPIRKQTVDKNRKLKRNVQFFWNRHLSESKKVYRKILTNSTVIGDAYISRYNLDYKYQNRDYLSKYIISIKELWQDKEVVFVEGKYSRLGVGNNFFDNAKSIERIVCPPKNSFSKYNAIYESILNKVSKDKLIILALGATATILAYDLTKVGYQALDLGNLDIEYEWYKMNAKKKVPIPSKDVNDANVKEGLIQKDCLSDEKYYNQIIVTIE